MTSLYWEARGEDDANQLKSLVSLENNTKKDSSRIQGTEMKFLRHMLGKTRSDRIQNTKIREILKLSRIHDEIEDIKLRW